MGILSDVTRPIEELIRPTEGLGEQLLREKLQPEFAALALFMVDMHAKFITSLLQHRG